LSSITSANIATWTSFGHPLSVHPIHIIIINPRVRLNTLRLLIVAKDIMSDQSLSDVETTGTLDLWDELLNLDEHGPVASRPQEDQSAGAARAADHEQGVPQEPPGVALKHAKASKSAQAKLQTVHALEEAADIISDMQKQLNS
jgi:hypothetical protein